MNSNKLLDVEEAVTLIQSDTRSNPVVDIAYEVNSLPYLQAGRTFNIKLLKRDTDGRIVSNGSVFVAVNSEYERARLEHEIVEHYKQNSRNHETIDPSRIGIHSKSSVVENGVNNTGRPIEVSNIDPNSIKKGGEIK